LGTKIIENRYLKIAVAAAQSSEVLLCRENAGRGCDTQMRFSNWCAETALFRPKVLCSLQGWQLSFPAALFPEGRSSQLPLRDCASEAEKGSTDCQKVCTHCRKGMYEFAKKYV
jgi:hypothetical protein